VIDSPDSGPRSASTIAWQIAVGVAALIVWHAVGATFGTRWVSTPSLVAVKLFDWFASGEIYPHLYTTVTEMLVGLVIGVSLGIVFGILLGMSRVVALVTRPLVFAIYTVPLVSLAPLLLMIFGIDMLPKIVLVATVAFFLVLFNTMKGVELVDQDLMDVLKLMGGRPAEAFRKVLLPASTAWILAGVKVALPYALVAATVGEMMAARRGLGYLLSMAAQRFDFTSTYAVLAILTVIGLLVAEAGSRIESRLLRWRPAIS
jgi:NitT/TauT family transport system permease protein